MNWNHVWELFKINLLYANPQAVTNLQKRQEKKKKANFSIVNAMLRQQLLILIIFTVVYSLSLIHICVCTPVFFGGIKTQKTTLSP